MDATVEVVGTIIGRVGSPLEYAVYVHDGTGLYGPRRRLIRPVNAQALSWRPRSSSGRVFSTFAQAAVLVLLGELVGLFDAFAQVVGDGERRPSALWLSWLAGCGLVRRIA